MADRGIANYSGWCLVVDLAATAVQANIAGGDAVGEDWQAVRLSGRDASFLDAPRLELLVAHRLTSLASVFVRPGGEATTAGPWPSGRSDPSGMDGAWNPPR